MKISVYATYDGMTPGEVEHYISEVLRAGQVPLTEEKIDAFKKGEEVEINLKDPNSNIKVRLSYVLEGF